MTVNTSLIERDLKHIWHPCAQMKDYETFKPMEVIGARGSYIQLNNGKKIIDAISSWWCKSLGHNHPRLKQALSAQMEKFEHVMFAHTTNEIIVALSEKLAQLTKSLSKVFYAGDGSCAVEIAMKMSLHARQISGESHKQLFIALENGYHGETVGALSVSDLGIYRHAYASMLFDAYFISPLPYVTGELDPLWHDCGDYWDIIEEKLNALAERTTAIVIEPIVQGAGGMRIYSQDFLKRLRAWTKQHNIHLIADEIMTGMGRTGKMLACQHAEIEPDFLCLSKGLTSGWLPFSAILTSEVIYNLFYDDYASGKSFLHSHTHSGNVLGASVALEVLNIFEDENILESANKIGKIMQASMLEIANITKKLTNVRSLGAMVAAEFIGASQGRRVGFEIYKKAAELGVLMRPLGNTIYWLPPLNIDQETLMQLKAITTQALVSVSLA